MELPPSPSLPLPRIDARFTRDLLLEVLASVDAPFLLLEDVHQQRPSTRRALERAHSRMRFLRHYERFAAVIEDCVFEMTRDGGFALEARVAYGRMLEGGGR